MLDLGQTYGSGAVQHVVSVSAELGQPQTHNNVPTPGTNTDFNSWNLTVTGSVLLVVRALAGDFPRGASLCNSIHLGDGASLCVSERRRRLTLRCAREDAATAAAAVVTTVMITRIILEEKTRGNP